MAAEPEELVRAQPQHAKFGFDLQVNAPAGGEPAPLVKLAVIGQRCLGHQARDLTAPNNGGAVEEASVRAAPRQAQDGDNGHFGLDDQGKRLNGTLEQAGIEKQVFRRVAGQAQLGKQGHRDIGLT